jgi:hypothetical protein
MGDKAAILTPAEVMTQQLQQPGDASTGVIVKSLWQAANSAATQSAPKVAAEFSHQISTLLKSTFD